MTARVATTLPGPDRLLALLAEGDARLDPAADRLTLLGRDGMKRRRIDPTVVEALARDGLLAVMVDADGARRLDLTETGRARLRRTAATAPAEPFRRQHGDVTARTEDGLSRVVEEAESPLAWLARRKDKDGRAYLTPARVAAGERLRVDFTRGELMPTVTSNWSIGRVSGGGTMRPGGRDDPTDRAIAARARVHAALDAVGADLAGLLVDVCCFLKGLETVESERRWPARSAKVVLDIALGRLADHYGFSDEAAGPERARGLVKWGTPDHRPTIGGPTTG